MGRQVPIVKHSQSKMDIEDTTERNVWGWESTRNNFFFMNTCIGCSIRRQFQAKKVVRKKKDGVIRMKSLPVDNSGDRAQLLKNLEQISTLDPPW